MVEMKCCPSGCSGEIRNNSYVQFERNIHRFCDTHVGNIVLFTVFKGMWPPVSYDLTDTDNSTGRDICNKLLARQTSLVLDDLAAREVVRALDLYQTIDPRLNPLITLPSVGYFSGYPYYEILPHDPLVPIVNGNGH